MATIVVNDLSNVTVDGVPAGSVTDVLTNFKAVLGIRGDLLRAVQAWAISRDQAHETALQAQQVAHAAALAERDATIATLQAQLQECKGLVDALGGTDLAQRLRRESRRQELLAAQQAAAEELAALDAGGDG